MSDKLYCCRFRDDSLNPELVEEFLIGQGIESSSWENYDEKITHYTIYCETEEESKKIQDQLSGRLDELKEYGILLSDISLLSIEREEWAEVWKKHFDLIHISERLTIRPSWIEYSPKENESVIDIDPGMSFGTGQHATTSFCLKMIDQLNETSDAPTLLDAGSGSGILSIAAAKLGYSTIDAFDIDPDAVRVAKENIEMNHLTQERINMMCCPIEEFPLNKTYDIVAANILSHVLKRNKAMLVSAVKDNGHLILAGILKEEFDSLKEEFVALGLEFKESFVEKEWCSGLFQKQQ